MLDGEIVVSKKPELYSLTQGQIDRWVGLYGDRYEHRVKDGVLYVKHRHNGGVHICHGTHDNISNYHWDRINTYPESDLLPECDFTLEEIELAEKLIS